MTPTNFKTERMINKSSNVYSHASCNVKNINTKKRIFCMLLSRVAYRQMTSRLLPFQILLNKFGFVVLNKIMATARFVAVSDDDVSAFSEQQEKENTKAKTMYDLKGFRWRKTSKFDRGKSQIYENKSNPDRCPINILTWPTENHCPADMMTAFLSSCNGIESSKPGQKCRI